MVFRALALYQNRLCSTNRENAARELFTSSLYSDIKPMYMQKGGGVQHAADFRGCTCFERTAAGFRNFIARGGGREGRKVLRRNRVLILAFPKRGASLVLSTDILLSYACCIILRCLPPTGSTPYISTVRTETELPFPQ